MTTTQHYDPLISGEAPAIETLPDLENMEVWPDQIRVGDYVAGFEVTQLTKADHYRQAAVRLTLETDPELREVQAEVGRLVLITDRTKGHQLPIQRPVNTED